VLFCSFILLVAYLHLHLFLFQRLVTYISRSDTSTVTFDVLHVSLSCHGLVIGSLSIRSVWCELVVGRNRLEYQYDLLHVYFIGTFM
jgi:hypothetical protein